MANVNMMKTKSLEGQQDKNYLKENVVTVDIERVIVQEAAWLADELNANKALNPGKQEVRPSAALRHALAVDAFIAKQVRTGKTILVRHPSGNLVELDWGKMTELFD